MLYIVSFFTGKVLTSFNGWDLRNVIKAEQWIKENNYVIYHCENRAGVYIVTVRRL